jgi:hypothetical protein
MALSARSPRERTVAAEAVVVAVAAEVARRAAVAVAVAEAARDAPESRVSSLAPDLRVKDAPELREKSAPEPRVARVAAAADVLPEPRVLRVRKSLPERSVLEMAMSTASRVRELTSTPSTERMAPAEAVAAL